MAASSTRIQPEPAQKTFDTYTSLMLEIKLRLFAVDDLMGSRTLPHKIIEESCNLQLRFCCETLALACLLAHGDISAAKAKDLQKAYEPPRIISMLEKLHAGFFPAPVRQTTGADGVMEFVDLPAAESAKALTKEQLVQFWNQVGGKLHRGSMRQLLSLKKQPGQSPFPNIIRTRDKFRALLDQHSIQSFDKSLCFFCLTNVFIQGTPVTGAVARPDVSD